MINLTGKGFFIWKLINAENDDANAIATLAAQAKLTHVLIKIADGITSSNVDSTTGIDLIPPVAQALRSRQIQVWGWHYVYGDDPLGEANKAIERVQGLNLDGYVIDAEVEYKDPGKDNAARTFMTQLRASLPTFPVALSSYRFPSFHPDFPWAAFLEKCDYNMPQVYWLLNHNPGEQLIRSVREFQALVPFRPIIPVGAAFTQSSWAPTDSDEIEFLKTAQSLNLTAVNFYEWANCRTRLPADIWNTIASYSWPVPVVQDIALQYVAALNTRDVNQVLNLYTFNAVHVNAARTIQGLDALRAWYNTFFNQVLPNATFTLTGYSGEGSSRHLNWTATSSAGRVLNGNDTLGLVNGKIAYHYTFFTKS